MSIINNLTATWNDSTALFYGYEMNFTDGFAGPPVGNSLSRFMSLKSNGTEKFGVDASGNIYANTIVSSANVINALTYCVGNGSADDRANFQTAVNAAAGKTLWVPAAQYLFKYNGTYNAAVATNNPIIYIPNNTTILFDTEAVILSQGAPVSINGCPFAVFRNVDQSAVNINSNITIIGGQFKVQNNSYGGSCFFGFRYTTRVFIRSVQLLETQGSVRCCFEHCSHSSISDYYVGYSTGFVKVQQPNQLLSIWDYEDGLRIGSGCDSFVVDDFDINSGDDSIALNNEPTSHVGTSGNDITNIVIGNGITTSQRGQSVRLFQESTMTDGVHKNISVCNLVCNPTSVLDGIAVQDQSNRHAIGNVTFDNVYVSGANVVQNAWNFNNVDTATISNCTAFNPGRAGFNVTNCYRVRIINPSVSASRTATYKQISINSASASCAVIGGSLLNSADAAMEVSGSIGMTVISGVMIDTPVGNGITITGSSVYTAINGCTFNGIAAGQFCVSENSGCDYTIYEANNMENIIAARRIDYSAHGANSRYMDPQQNGWFSNTLGTLSAVTAGSIVAGLGNGLTMGAPTGGDKGVGTINLAADIYKNNTAYTNPKWALKHYFRGTVDKTGAYAPSFDYKGLVPLPQLEVLMSKELELPLMLENPDGGLFERGDMLLASLEEAYIYIVQLHNRVSKLEEQNDGKNKTLAFN